MPSRNATTTTTTEAAIWARVIHPQGKFSVPAAKAILRLSFPTVDRVSMRKLAAKARAGILTPDEEMEADNYERVGHLLSLLKSKARQVLQRKRTHS